jgi:electron transport complex protein RnfD
MLFAVWQFGLPALSLIAVTVVSALLIEVVCGYLNPTLKDAWRDGSTLLTAVLLAMSLPPHAPLWLGALGSLFAVALGKHCYGGLGQNLFNPAMLARVVLLIAFPLEMTQWPEPMSNLADPTWYLQAADGFSGATPLASLNHGAKETLNSGLGLVGGSLGETSSLLIVLGGLYLIIRNVIGWQLPLATLVGCLFPATLYWLLNGEAMSPVDHLVNGGLLLGAFFIITDPVTSPTTNKGQWIYGLLFGLLVWLIRTFANYPEGIAFAVLLCNSTNPLIEHYTRPVIYGHGTNKQPEGL